MALRGYSGGWEASAVRRLRRAIRGSWILWLASGFVVLLVGVAALVPYLHLADPFAQSLERLAPPAPEHPFGTDRLGRDVLSRTVWATRYALAVGIGTVAVGGTVGTVWGMAAGFSGPFAQEVLSRLVDVFLAFPPLILAMVVVTLLGNGVFPVVVALSFGIAPRFARVARAVVLAVRVQSYVEAARAIGASSTRILLRHILPNTLDSLIVLGTLTVPTAILTEALLSFLGIGIVEPTPTWGNIASMGQMVLREAPWVVLFPSLALLCTVLSFNLLGDAVRDALDPTTSRGVWMRRTERAELEVEPARLASRRIPAG
ncbi:MAG: ABC transporter permease [Armatimonadota bacterium]|nr:ABC transporter permease [Armatimonadota bacterium]MDR7440240.1 ABC transporter permease [Armatimonadota bacterium]MDR7562573.1 ABC transporter permease [Armatimonadota bacterium]MDR7567409.1 ABC transporter permease [Armatimonadota bacterium]MDR7602368.1 ABC transporter permease [Armatimonadota bacterium]